MVDNDYFETAYRVLEQHPQILGSRIAMLGLSFGTTVTLRMAVYSQVVKVGRLQCPLLLVVGEDDQNWPTYESAIDMREMMERAGNSHLLTVLSYKNAGHLIEPPFTPFVRASSFRTEDAWRKTLVFLRENLYGGMKPGALFSNLTWTFPRTLGPLGGGGGKLVEYRAALLASHGIASLALDYLTPQIINKGTGKMILGSRIAMLGLSFCTAVTLRTAVYSEVLTLSCAVCINGSHVQPIDGPVEQIMTYFNKNVEKTRYNEDNQVIWRDLLLPIPTDPSLKVDQLGRLQCPLLLIVGEDAQN
ncbi:hypothetical protein F7725_015937 [Dissostichus mawsoni]|uniref:BAAT/Acyl-CoA thioester hydrolase C-terminal domain-containing protein n=1 Tax=Dissostichus mawsoni TaxID=36200 RepID=A0A7J5Y523_DISMA|nr:hypothetical protein F7725_015937 [Dissostichus mawsoni]